ncbi:hypothetical protein LMG26684_02055 [Achromobacter mucicolens]|uniref:Mu transposase C-terminal domain-containing protein n=1 Tax=Achromobacter mucicolens TaxID=1389922 RepID=UPI0014669DA4|nr:Mu transposase C-terminal domain-containing protein [Achromobacter mucicolens]CAB3850567.1 hypothetical protein LMG26684_02055 [Achromobacter mucicolens]
MTVHRIQRGLTLKIGERPYEFDRLLENNSVVQLEDLATGARKTFSIAKLQKEVSLGNIQILGTSPEIHNELSLNRLREPLPYLLERLTPEQDRILNRKRAYVEAARRRGLDAKSGYLLDEVISTTAEKLEDKNPPAASSVCRWLAAYERSGRNIMALIPRTAFRARSSRTPAWVISLAWSCLREHYFKRDGKSLRETHDIFVGVHRKECVARATEVDPSDVMSRSTFWRLCQTVPAYERDKARKGAAYAAHKWRHSIGGVYSTRPLERVEMDHTMLDIYVVDDKRHMPLGRPTLTMIIDSFTNYILAIYISFEGESLGRVARTIRMALTLKDDIVAQVGAKNDWLTPGMWECLVVDNALAFQSPQLQRIANVLGCGLEFAAVRRPWFKPTVERHMLEVTRLLPAEGRTRKPGVADDPRDPIKEACVTFSDLNSAILKWAIDVHPFGIPERTLVRPIDKLKEGLISDPAPVLVPDLDELRFLTALEQGITVGAGGVEFMYLSYRSEQLGELAKRQASPTFKTAMRYDPGDLGSIWVNDPATGGWISVPCLNPGYANDLSLYQHRFIRAHAKKVLKTSGAIEDLIQAKADLRDRFLKMVKSGKKLQRQLRQFAIMEGVTSESKLKDRVQVPKTPTSDMPDQLILVDDNIPIFEVFDPNARDGWE